MCIRVILSILPLLVAVCASADSATAPHNVALHYDRKRDGAIAETTALRAFTATSNAFEHVAEFGPMRIDNTTDTATASTTRILWGAPPQRLVLERTTSAEGRLQALRAYAEPLVARAPARPPKHAKHAAAEPVILEVPMLRQTTQGTCAPITVASLLQYYDIPMTAEALESAIPVTESKGANVEELLAYVEREIFPGTGLSLHETYGFEIDRFVRLLTAYNQEAEKHHDTPRLYWRPPVLHLDRAFAHADSALLHEVANAQPGRERFWRTIRRSIDAGHPLLWGVLLGAVHEPKLTDTQSLAGHLRLIVGYCAETETLYFSDPWGPAHIAKPLPLHEAWTETLTLHALRVSKP